MASKPIARDDSFDFAFGSSAYKGNFLSNDTAGGNGKLFLRNFDGETVGAKQANQVTTVEGEYGTFKVKADGSFTYELKSEFSGSLGKGQVLTESVYYKVSDGTGTTDYALAKINIASVSPLAVDDKYSFNENDTISGNVLDNDKPGANGKLVLTRVEDTGIGAKQGPDQITTVKGDFGTFKFSPNGEFTYDLDDTVAAGLDAGEQVTETLKYYKISDGLGHTDAGIITLVINGENDQQPTFVQSSSDTLSL